MVQKTTFMTLFLSFIAILMVGWVSFEIYRGNYLEAVAICGVGSALLWFATGAGKASED